MDLMYAQRASQHRVSAAKTILAISVTKISFSVMGRRSSAVSCPADGGEDGCEREYWSVIPSSQMYLFLVLRSPRPAS
jgi:hypothetical protein